MFPFLLLAACTETTTTGTTGCSLGVPTLSATTAAPGEAIVLTAGPLTEAWDTAITVGATRAQVVALDRSTCGDCDTCRATAECATCGECESCDTTCATCVETVTFTVPDLAPGAWAVELVNKYGRTEQVQLTVTAPADTGPADTGPADTADTSTP